MACAFQLFRSLNDHSGRQVFACSQGLFVLCSAGPGIRFFPWIVPPSISIHAAAGPPESLRFLLVGTSILLPLILAGTACACWIFRGKARPHGGWH